MAGITEKYCRGHGRVHVIIILDTCASAYMILHVTVVRLLDQIYGHGAASHQHGIKMEHGNREILLPAIHRRNLKGVIQFSHRIHQRSPLFAIMQNICSDWISSILCSPVHISIINNEQVVLNISCCKNIISPLAQPSTNCLELNNIMQYEFQ